jgi:hypothetical protein
MTDAEHIKDLERRVAQIEDILTRLEVSGDAQLNCRTGVDEYGNTTRTNLGCYIQSRCKFGSEKKGTSKTKDDFYPNGTDNAKHIDPDKLAYILLSRKIITSRDYDFMLGKESFSDWKQYNKNRSDNNEN